MDGLFNVTYVVCTVAVNVVSNTLPDPKSDTLSVVLKLVVFSAEVPTCTFNSCPVLSESKALTCILYVVSFTVENAWYAA